MYQLPQPPWDVSERSQSDFHWERHLRDLSESSQKRWIFGTSLRRLQHISFVWRLQDISSISQKRCLFRDISEISQKYLSQVFVIFQKYPTKMASCVFRRVIEISNKIDVETLETLQKWNVSGSSVWLLIKSVMSISGLISASEFRQVHDNESPKCIIKLHTVNLY